MSDGARKRLTIARIHARDGDLCFYCGKRMRFPWDDPRVIRARKVSLEHLIDRSLGGTLWHSNAVLAHDKCNSSRQSMKTLAEKMASRFEGASVPPLAIRKALANEQASRSEMIQYRQTHGYDFGAVRVKRAARDGR